MNSTITQYEYRITQAQYTIEGCTYTVYGLSVYRRDADNVSVLPVREIPNISLSRARTAELADRCNRLQPSLLHLDDILEDFLP